MLLERSPFPIEFDEANVPPLLGDLQVFSFLETQTSTAYRPPVTIQRVCGGGNTKLIRAFGGAAV